MNWQNEIINLIRAFGEKLGIAFEKIADSAGVAATKIFEWAMLQVIVNGVRFTMFLVLMLVLDWIFINIISQRVKVEGKRKWKLRETINWQSDDAGLYILFGVLLLIPTIIALGIFMVHVPQFIINPEYSAFEIILDKVMELSVGRH